MVSCDIFTAVGGVEEVVTEEAHGFEFVDEFNYIAVGQSGLEIWRMRSVRRNTGVVELDDSIAYLGLFLLGVLEPRK